VDAVVLTALPPVPAGLPSPLSPTAAAAVPPDLRLQAGETVLDVVPNVTHVCPFDGPVAGTLVLTNFKLIFESLQPEDETKHTNLNVAQWKGNGTVHPSLPRPGPEVTLGHIDRVEKEGGMRTKREHAYCIVVYCRDARHLRFAFVAENHSRRPFYDKLLHAAFPVTFGVNPPFFAMVNKEAYPGGPDGWRLHDLEKEMARQGVPLEAGPHGWRISDANREYVLCASYPQRWVVPAQADDAMLAAVAKFRSRGRLPILVWRHRRTGATITRCAQPLVGMWNRSEDDERYLAMIADATPRPSAPAARPAAPSAAPSPSTRLVIVDARPRANALANQAKGAGFETSSAYPDMPLEFLDIQNIHVMRESLRQVHALCFPGVEEAQWYSRLQASRWLDHVRLCLVAARRIVDLVEDGVPVLVHCSDGWDRTSQLTSLALLMLDPYYRTRHGFAVLVEREWVETGHKFAQRTGHGDSHAGDDQRAPIFVQFLDAVYQLVAQFPAAFEFNSRFLVALADELYSCRFGTFLYNTDRERQAVKGSTPSVWTYLLAPSPVTDTFVNPRYRAQERVLRPATAIRRLRVWSEYYVRWTPQIALGTTAPLHDWQIAAATARLFADGAEQ